MTTEYFNFLIFLCSPLIAIFIIFIILKSKDSNIIAYLLHKSNTSTYTPSYTTDAICGEMLRVNFDEFKNYYKDKPTHWTLYNYTYNGKRRIFFTPRYTDDRGAIFYVYFQTFADFCQYNKFAKKEIKRLEAQGF